MGDSLAAGVSSSPLDRKDSSGQEGENPSNAREEEQQQQQHQEQQHEEGLFHSSDPPHNKSSFISLSTASSVSFGARSFRGSTDLEQCGDSFGGLVDTKEGKGNNQQQQQQQPLQQETLRLNTTPLSSAEGAETGGPPPDEEAPEPTERPPAAKAPAPAPCVVQQQQQPLLLQWGHSEDSSPPLNEGSDEERDEETRGPLGPLAAPGLTLPSTATQGGAPGRGPSTNAEEEPDLLAACAVSEEPLTGSLDVGDPWNREWLTDDPQRAPKPVAPPPMPHPQHQQQQQRQQQLLGQQQSSMERLWAQPWLWSYSNLTSEEETPASPHEPLGALQQQRELWCSAVEYESSGPHASSSSAVDQRRVAAITGAVAPGKRVSSGGSVSPPRPSPMHVGRGAERSAGVPEEPRWWGGAGQPQEALQFVEEDLLSSLGDRGGLRTPWELPAASLIQGDVGFEGDLLRQQLGLIAAPAAVTAGVQPAETHRRATLPVETIQGPSANDPLWVLDARSPVHLQQQQPQPQQRQQATEATPHQRSVTQQLLQGDVQQRLLLDLAPFPLLQTPDTHTLPAAESSAGSGRWRHRSSSSISPSPPAAQAVGEGEAPQRPVRPSEGGPLPPWTAPAPAENAGEAPDVEGEQQLHQQRLLLLQRDEAVLALAEETSSNNGLGIIPGGPGRGTRTERRRQRRQAELQVAVVTSSFRSPRAEGDGGRHQPFEGELQYVGTSPHGSWEGERRGLSPARIPYYCADAFGGPDSAGGPRAPRLFTEAPGAGGRVPWLAPGGRPGEAALHAREWPGGEGPSLQGRGPHAFPGRDVPPAPTTASSSSSSNARTAGLSSRELVDLAGLMLSLQMRHDAESFATVFDPTQRLARRGSAAAPAAAGGSSSSRSVEPHGAKGGRRASDAAGGGQQATYTLIVNVPPNTTRQDLLTTFSAFGRVELTVVVCDKEHRHPNREWTATSGQPARNP